MSALSPMMTLKTFFGMKPDQKLADFSREVNDLTPESKTELSNLAKAEMIRQGTHKAEDFGF